ncbi:unnamed protein product [Didymodactylos carnosus]|nr:unnamed protein product [Didymodactylos carnosus]CAF4071177.1 unnamed protein product [Didymodactylos carnosus]
MSGYALSLDGIIGLSIQKNVKIKNQANVVKISVTVVSLMFAISLITNTLSIITFSQPKTRDVGCGTYLLFSSIISLLTITIFSAKFIYLLMTQIMMNPNRPAMNVSCILLEFLLKFLSTTGEWLNAVVAIERALTVALGATFNTYKKTSASIAKYVFILVLLINIITSIHDPIYRRLIDDRIEERTWCAITYQNRPWLKYYTSTLNSIHFIIPFAINVVSAILIIIKSGRAKSNAQTDQPYRQILKKQLIKQKHLIISPLILVILASPRLIISFVYVCMKSTREPYLFLFGYFISYLPFVTPFLIFVLPSETYKKECLTGIKKLSRRH